MNPHAVNTQKPSPTPCRVCYSRCVSNKSLTSGKKPLFIPTLPFAQNSLLSRLLFRFHTLNRFFTRSCVLLVTRAATHEWLGEEVDEDNERHGADWQGTKQPYQLALTPTMNAIRAGCHHAIRMNDGSGMLLAAACGVQIRFFWACSQPRQSCACMLAWGLPGIKWRRFSPTFRMRRDKGVSRGSPFPGAGRGSIG